MLKDEKHQAYVKEVKENFKKYQNIKMDSPCDGYDQKSLQECMMKKFMESQVYFWVLLAGFSSLTVRIFFTRQNLFQILKQH